MKKLICFIFIFTIFYCTLNAQNAFYDAQKIAQILNVNADTSSIKQAVNRSLSYFKDENDSINYGGYFRLMNKRITDRIAALTLSTNNVEKICELCKSLTNAGKDIRAINQSCNTLHSLDSLSRQQQQLSIYLDSLFSATKDSLNKVQNNLKLKTRDSLFIDSLPMAREIEMLKNDTIMLNIKIDSISNKKNEKNEIIKAGLDSIKQLNIDVQKKFISLLKGSPDLFKTDEMIKKLELAKEEFADVQKKISAKLNVLYSTANVETLANTGSVNETTTLTNFKIPSQSEMIDALAIYIARRFKQEMALTLVAELRKSLNKQLLLKELFPETIKLFNNNEAYELPRFGKIWNHSISEDFIKLPDNIKASKYLQNMAFKTNSQKDFAMFKDLVTISNWIIQKNALPEIVSLYKTDSTTIESKPIKESFEIMNIINNELFDTTTGGQYWIGWRNLERMTPTEFTIFLNLLEIKYKPVFDSLAIKPPSEWGSRTAQTTALFKNYLTKILLTLNNFQSTQKQYLARLEKDPNVPYTGMSFWDFEKNLLSIVLNKAVINIPGNTEQVLTLIDRSTGLYKLLEEKNYAAMVHESMAILEEVLPVQNNRFNELVVKTWKLDRSKFKNVSEDFLQRAEVLRDKFSDEIIVMKHVYKDSLKTKEDFIKRWVEPESATYKYFNDSLRKDYKKLLVINTDHDLENTLFAFARDTSSLFLLSKPLYSKSRFLYVTKTAEFLTDVMSSGNSKQLASVMEAYGMPPNSYKIKRSSRFSVELNAYVGAFGGYEFIRKTNSAGEKYNDGSPVYGISVPVGLSTSWGYRRKPNVTSSSLFINRKGAMKDLTGNSFSLSFTIIDLTAVVTYRLEKGENEALPKEVKWSQILSPGIHGRWGIRNTPLCFSTGIQYTPQLRNLTDKSAAQQAWRVYGGLFFDLPLYNLYKR